MTKNETPAEVIEPVAELTEKPPATALEALQRLGREPLTIWKTRGPKTVGGLTITAVLCQDTNEIVVTHTLASGKFAVFAKVAM